MTSFSPIICLKSSSTSSTSSTCPCFGDETEPYPDVSPKLPRKQSQRSRSSDPPTVCYGLSLTSRSSRPIHVVLAIPVVRPSSSHQPSPNPIKGPDPSSPSIPFASTSPFHLMAFSHKNDNNQETTPTSSRTVSSALALLRYSSPWRVAMIPLTYIQAYQSCSIGWTSCTSRHPARIPGPTM